MTRDLTTLPPLLIPRPAHLTTTHPPPHPSTPSSLPPRSHPDPSLPHHDTYRLTIASNTITIAHNSPAALAYAHATLAQLRTQYGNGLPQLDILDYPAIPTRGLMLDISRDRIPTMPELHRLIPELASLKLNHLQLYTEHTFAYAGHEEVWQGWNPITPAELLELQTLCARHTIELAANQNCFGHLTHWLKHERYAPLAETHGDWMFDRFKRSGPFSLCPGDPGSIELVRDLLAQLLPLFRSPLANVGCDETYDLGQGRSKHEVAKRGKAPVYFDFLDQVFAAVRAHNKRPMFWADVALNHPDHIHRVPDNAIALAWGYEADTDFDRWCDILRSADKTTWVCPGTSSWRSITGRTSVRRANCQAAADTAAKYGLPGYLITDWGDAGHHQTWPIALIAIAEAADTAWNAGRDPSCSLSRAPRERAGERAPPSSSTPLLEQAISLHYFHDPTLTTATWLATLGDIDRPLRPRAGRSWFEGKGQPLHNASAHYADLAEPWDSRAAALTADDFHPPLASLKHSRTTLPTNLPDLLHAELTHTLDHAELATQRAIARRSPSGAGHCGPPSPSPLLDLAQRVQSTHAALWPHRSRPGLGLADSLAHHQRIIEELHALESR